MAGESAEEQNGKISIGARCWTGEVKRERGGDRGRSNGAAVATQKAKVPVRWSRNTRQPLAKK